MMYTLIYISCPLYFLVFRKMQEAFVRLNQVQQLGDEPVLRIRTKLRMLYLEGGLRAEETELVRHPRIHLNKLQHFIVPDGQITLSSTVTRAAAKMKAKGRAWALVNKCDGIMQGKHSMELKSSLINLESNGKCEIYIYDYYKIA